MSNTYPACGVDPPRPRTWEHVLIVATTVHSGRRLHGSRGDTEWTDEEMTRSRVDDILSALSEAGPQSSWPGRLVEECRQATEMSGVGLALMGEEGAAGILAATSGHAQQMEDLQFELGEGPCMDASRSGRPVFCSDLALDGDKRWPVFAPGARQAGVEAAFTFPLQVGAVGLGVLDLYRDRRGPLTAPQVSEAVAFADASVAVLLHLRGDAGPESDSRPGRAAENSGTDPAHGPAGVDWAELVDRRAVVHQAAGMISVQLDVNVAVALLRLRAHSFSHGRPISEVAAEVVARRLRFDDTDEGAAEGPGRPDPDEPPGEEPWR